MIQSRNRLTQGIDKAPMDRYTPAIWLRCPNKSRIWERSNDTLHLSCWSLLLPLSPATCHTSDIF